MEKQKALGAVDGFGSIENTPCDIGWWVNMENRYGRDLSRENRERTNPDASDFIGFFGASSGFSYETLKNGHRHGDDLSEFADSVLPCDCTE